MGPHRARGTRFRTHQAPGLAFFPPQVYGDKDADGFYRGETCARLGLIPCNMVSEIQADDDEMMDQLLRQGFLPLNTPVEKAGKRLRATPSLSQQRRLRARDQAAPPSGATDRKTQRRLPVGEARAAQRARGVNIRADAPPKAGAAAGRAAALPGPLREMVTSPHSYAGILPPKAMALAGWGLWQGARS